MYMHSLWSCALNQDRIRLCILCLMVCICYSCAQCMKYKCPNCSTTDSHCGVLIQSQYHILNPSVPVPIMSGKYVAHAQSSFFHFGTVIIHIYCLVY